MTENDTNKPSEPQDPDTTLKDRRRILEELTPNITAKQLSEQLARMKRAHELDDEQPVNPAAAQDPAPSSTATTATPQDASTSEDKAVTPNTAAEAPAAEQNHTKPPEKSTTEAEVALTKATEESAWRTDTAVLLSDEKQPKNEAAVAETEKTEKTDKPETTDQPVQTADSAPTTLAPPRPAEASTASKTESLPDPKTILEAPAQTVEKPAEPAAKAEASDDNDSSSELDHNLGRSPQNKHDTAVLEGKSPFRRALQQKSTGEHQTASLGENREIILVIRGMVERLILQDDKRIILGRTDVKSRFLPDVDLTPYGALDRGVSREHASLHLDGDRLYVTDLGSTNGTFLSGNKLDPNVPSILRKGDELLLGRLPVQVLFR